MRGLLRRGFGAVIATWLAAAALVAGGEVPDAGEEDRAARVEQRIEAARERLALTDEQAEAVVPILKAAAAEQAAVLKKHGIDLEARAGGERQARLGLRGMRILRGEMDAVRAETVEKLGEVLSDEQIAEYRKMQDENRSEMRRRIRSAR